MPLVPSAAGAESIEDWLDGEYATGNEGRLRDTLEDKGVTFEGADTTDLMAVRNGNAGFYLSLEQVAYREPDTAFVFGGEIGITF